MLRGIDPLLSADLLYVLAAMGHGDRIVLVDANYPATSAGPRVIPMPGVSAPAALAAILTVLPIDTFEPGPTAVMKVVGEEDKPSPPELEFINILQRHGHAPPARLGRHAFYQAASRAFAIVHTGERRFYGNTLLTKGVIGPDGKEA
jgi:L-fucose mutarotase